MLSSSVGGRGKDAEARAEGGGTEEKAEVVLRFLRGCLTAREDEVPRGTQLFEREKPWRVNPKRVSGMK